MLQHSLHGKFASSLVAVDSVPAREHDLGESVPIQIVDKNRIGLGKVVGPGLVGFDLVEEAAPLAFLQAEVGRGDGLGDGLVCCGLAIPLDPYHLEVTLDLKSGQLDLLPGFEGMDSKRDGRLRRLGALAGDKPAVVPFGLEDAEALAFEGINEFAPLRGIESASGRLMEGNKGDPRVERLGWGGGAKGDRLGEGKLGQSLKFPGIIGLPYTVPQLTKDFFILLRLDFICPDRLVQLFALSKLIGYSQD